LAGIEVVPGDFVEFAFRVAFDSTMFEARERKRFSFERSIRDDPARATGKARTREEYYSLYFIYIPGFIPFFINFN